MKYYLLLSGAVLALTSCVKHEVIPPPTPPLEVVVFDCSFEGDIDGDMVSLVKDVNGFFCSHLKKVETATGDPTTGKWDNDILHSSSSEKVKIRHGKMTWPNTMTLPSTMDWKDFFTSNFTPILAADGDGGVEFEYTDNTGDVFSTQDTSTYANEIIYTFLESDSASNGLFVKFTATVDCKVYSEAGLSKIISGGILKGAYKYE